MLVGCLLCVPVGDDSCLTDGLVVLSCLDVEVAVVHCNVKVMDNYVVEGLTVLDDVDGAFDVNVNFDVVYVENDVKE